MKELWIEVDASTSSNVKTDLFKLAEQVCDVILVDRSDVQEAKNTKTRIASTSDDCDITILDCLDGDSISKAKASGRKVAIKISVESKEDEERAVKAASLSADYILIDCPNWKIIPLENLIAKVHGKTALLAEVTCSQDARLALETMELGADGVVLKTSDRNELLETAKIAGKQASEIQLVPAKIVDVRQIGTGARVCVDTCDLMKPGEGILVGCQSSGLFLVEAEVHENPFVETRPFRVNAGPVSLYALTSPKSTKYLSELKAGNEVLIVDAKGNSRVANVGRTKIEWRPLILIEAESNGRRIKTILQNAETIRLVAKDGSKSVGELKIGDEVLAHVTNGGRHFGTLIKEESVLER
jgi:3-dehydroquinate synthase II